MGKAKKRGFRRGDLDDFFKLSREDALKEVVKLLKENDNNAFSLITLFGLSAEELLEAGADYEDVVKMGCMLK